MNMPPYLPSATSTRLLVLVGPPGCGKSTFASALVNALPNWVRVNQDDLGSRQACESLARASLPRNNVVIDRCNFDNRQRGVWIRIGQNAGVNVECIFFGTSYEECERRIISRQNHPTGVEGPRGIEILRRFVDDLREPRLEEGFHRVMTIMPWPTSTYGADEVREIIERLDRMPIQEVRRRRHYGGNRGYHGGRSHHEDRSGRSGYYGGRERHFSSMPWRPPSQSLHPPSQPPLPRDGISANHTGHSWAAIASNPPPPHSSP
ncbi:uncharacterized protein VTP21DRAFT_5015 [Calcarisporiella thermophila]|uniref:uncharacterized protein n=1 Tax=Calcarisporiella thermophila TaxID=911321 RepID=UPI003742A669